MNATRVIDLRERARACMPDVMGPSELYAAARATWLGRMRNEYGSATVFEGLARQLALAGVSPERVTECEAMSHEERRHGVLCGAVVEALGGSACAEIPVAEPLPEHLDVTRLEAALRNVISVCCLSETVAVALITAEYVEMPEGSLRELLGSILADEVGHARFGWRWLKEIAPELSVETKRRLADYLVVAFGHLEAHELEHLPETSSAPEQGKTLGLCNGRDARMLFYDTLSDVIVPELEACGIHARKAWIERRRALRYPGD